MYRMIARDLGFTFEPDKEPSLMVKKNFPNMFLGIVLSEWNGYQIMAIGLHNLNNIIKTDRFPQIFGKRDIKNKPLIFRRFETLDGLQYDFISADVSKIWSPRYGKMICKTHPKHGLTKKFAPLGKVYNEIYCLLPVFRPYGISTIEYVKDNK